jgi:hypothetical protein
VWSFAWWPHALAHLTSPFVTHALYVPGGINLTWTASSPGLALALSPVTVLFGPTVAYNVAAILLPALAVWTAYLLCRHVTGSVFASAIAGYLFGFSTAMLGQEVLPLLAVAALFPAVWRTSYPAFRPSHPERVAFFADDLYGTCLPKGGGVAVFPFGNEVDTLLWQAESDFGFRLAAGGLAPVPSSGKPLTAFDAEPFVTHADLRSARPTFDRLLGFVAVHGVDRIVPMPGDD